MTGPWINILAGWGLLSSLIATFLLGRYFPSPGDSLQKKYAQEFEFPVLTKLDPVKVRQLLLAVNKINKSHFFNISMYYSMKTQVQMPY